MKPSSNSTVATNAALRTGILLFRLAAVLALLAVAGAAAFWLSPWPRVLLIRRAFASDAARTAEALLAHAPKGAREVTVSYDANDPDAFLDLHTNELVPTRAPLVVWIHGGAFVFGSRRDVAGYAKVLAGRGFAVAAIGYSLAPRFTYPTPVRQLNRALGYLIQHAAEHRIDARRIVLAGDSAGAHIACQLATAATSPPYAKLLEITPALSSPQLAGVLLHCGPYDAGLVNFDGPFGGFMQTVLWSYMGARDFRSDPKLDHFSVTNHVTSAFPPAFVSVGSADPLAPHSEALVSRLRAQGLQPTTLFWPTNNQPRLEHEYQFNLDTPAGKTALERGVEFLQRCAP